MIVKLNITNINNELFDGDSVLQLVVTYIVRNSNKSNDLAYKMFDHLLNIGAYINKTDYYGKDINFYIMEIRNKTIKNKLHEIIKNHKTSKY